jgi:hypothetical protein
MNKKGQAVANNTESPMKVGDQQQPDQEQPNEENIQDFM